MDLIEPSALPPPGPAEALSRRARKKERTRQEIYRAALTLFAERGFDAVTVDQICHTADVAKATFFLHFPTKSALLFEFGRGLADEMREQLREPRPPAVAELHQMLELFSQRWLEHGAVMAAMLRAFLRTPESVLAMQAEGDALRHLVESILRRGQARGELRASVDARLAAAIFFSTSFAILSGAVFRPEETSPEAVRAQFLEAFLHGLVTDASDEEKAHLPRKAAAKSKGTSR